MKEKKLSRRDFLLLSGGATVGTILAACGPAPTPQVIKEEVEVTRIVEGETIVETVEVPVEVTPETADVPPPEPAQITVMAVHDTMENMIPLFNDAYPHISIAFDYQPWGTWFETVQVRLAAQSGDPDVFQVDVPMTAPYGYRGWLLPLDDFFTQAEKDDFLEAAVRAGTYEGDFLAPPLSTSTQLLYYNKTLFDQVGVEPPGENERWTWEQVAEVAPDLTLDDNGDGIPETWGFIWEQYNRIYQMQPLPMSLGGKAIGDDGLSVRGVIDAEPWVEAFTYYRKAFNEWRFAPQGELAWPGDIFRTGKLAMLVGGSWNINQNAAADPPLEFEWGVSRHPYFADGQVVTPTGSWHIGVNSTTKVPDAAATFVRWITTAPGAEWWWRYGNNDMPAQKSILAKWQTEPEFAELPMYYNKIAADEATQNPQPRPVTPGYGEYEQILLETFDDIRNGAEVEAALATAVDRIEAEMTKYA
jgi:fructooligosaccharide transport system substrate-binding protein